MVMLAKGMTSLELYEICTKEEDPLTFIQRLPDGSERETSGLQLYQQFVYLTLDAAQP